MTSPFLTTNVFLINLSVLLLTTTLVGGIMTVLWLGIGKLLEKVGFVNIVFELLKMATFFYCFPLVYVLLKTYEKELGRGYLFRPTNQILVFATVFLAIWCLGMLVMLVYMLHDVIILKKRYADIFPCDSETQEVFESVLEELHLGKNGKRGKVQLRQSYRAQVPFVTGILNPTVILPVTRYSQEELTYILMHEVMHYKQGDILLKRVSIMVCAVHFFNPLAWLLLSEIQKWSEYACDYRVCQHKRKIQEYFEVLMNNAVGERFRSRLASQLVENRHELVERAKKMKSVYGKRRSKVCAVIILSVAFILSSITVCAATFETAEQYVLLNQETSKEVVHTIDFVQFEKYTEQGDSPDILAVSGTVDAKTRSINTFDWQVDERTKVYGPSFQACAGTMVTIRVNVVPSSVSVKVGIEDSAGNKEYMWVSGSVTETFDINYDDDYFFFVENTSNTAVTASGSYLTP